MQNPQFISFNSRFAAGNLLSFVARRSIGLLPVALLLAGCNRGPQLGPVSGRISLDGKPLADAEVRFEPATGRASQGHTGANGQYELRYSRDYMGALVGSHTVRILSATEVTLPDGRFVIRPQTVPTRYNTESELRRDVESSGNVFDFELTGDTKAKSGA